MRGVVIGSMLALWSVQAHADAFDTFGFGARAESLAGAAVASSDGHAGAHHNPGAVAMSDDIEASVGYGYGLTALRIDGENAHVTAPHGTSLGLSIPVHFGTRHRMTVAFGVALYLPDQYLARIELVPVTQPQFALLDNNLQRITVTPVLSFRPLPWLSLGAGATFLADAAGSGITFDVGLLNGNKVGQGGLDVSLPTRAAPVAGVVVRPKPWLTLGAAYRGQIDLRVALKILTNVAIAGGLSGDTVISLRAANFFTPQRVSLGARLQIVSWLAAVAEVDWINWHAFDGGIPDLQIQVALGISPSLVTPMFSTQRFHDIWVPRLGLELTRDLRPKIGFSARVGYAFEQSPVPGQTGLTSFADNDRHIIGFGAGIELRHLIRFLPKPLRIDVSAQLHELVGRATLKDPSLFPGAGFSSSGTLLHLAATLEAKF